MRLGCVRLVLLGGAAVCKLKGVVEGDTAGTHTPRLLTEHGKSSDGAAPFTRQQGKSSDGAAPFTRQQGKSNDGAAPFTRQQGKSSDRAAPFTRHKQQRGSALHTARAATGQRPSHDRSSKEAPLRHDKSSDGPAPTGYNGASWGPCPSTAGRGGRSVPPSLTQQLGAGCLRPSWWLGFVLVYASATWEGHRHVSVGGRCYMKDGEAFYTRLSSSGLLSVCLASHHVPLGCRPAC